jgi:hypothetical protein
MFSFAIPSRLRVIALAVAVCSETREWLLPPRRSHQASAASPTTYDSSDPRPARRAVTADAIFTPGPANTWATVFRARFEK